MEQLVFGDGAKTEHGYEKTIKYAENITMNLTFNMIINSLLTHPQNTLHLNVNTEIDDLASYIARACFHGQTIDPINKFIINNKEINMEIFLKRCIVKLSEYGFLLYNE